MKQTLLVAGQELIVNLRRPGFIIMTLAIPVLGIIALSIASIFGGEVGGFLESQFAPAQEAVGYVDRVGLLAGAQAQSGSQFIAYSDDNAARAALLAEEVESYFVLPADYMETGRVVVYGTGGGFSTFAAADSGDIRRFLVDQLLAGKVDQALQQRVRAPMDVQPVTLDEDGQVSTDSPFSWLGDFVVPYLFSILFVITIFTASGFLLQGVSEEKEGRIIEILISSISPTQLLVGKILGLGALGLIQISVWVGAAVILLAAAATVFSLTGIISISLSTVVLAVLYFVLGYLLFATLMAVAGSMGTTQRESQQIAGIFTMAAAIPWMAMGIVFANPDSTIAVILSYFPLTAPVMMLIRLGISSVPTGQIAISLTLLVAGIVLSIWAGAKIFRVGLLMYGKRPGLKDLSRAFKQA
ncbi:ABC transporter permease [Chloroflexota bacterium]